jgi:NAD(P)H dehydrogenase (quinone)
MRKIMLDDRLGMRFENKKMMILGGTLDLEKVRDIHLTEVMKIGKEIELSFR